MKAHFPKGRRELVVSGFQAAVLYAFNGAGSLVAGGKDSLSAVVSPTAADSLSFKQLLAETGLGTHLQRCRALRCHSPCTTHPARQ